MKSVLFICTHNSARSQMAEAFLNHLCSERYRAESAGTLATQVNSYAITVMEEIGISMEGHRSKSIKEFKGRTFDVVITVCDDAKEMCPFFPGKRVIHKGFRDPSEFRGSDDERTKEFRRVRDEIRNWIVEEFCKGNTKLNEQSIIIKNKKGGEMMSDNLSVISGVKEQRRRGERMNGISSHIFDAKNKERR